MNPRNRLTILAGRCGAAALIILMTATALLTGGRAAAGSPASAGRQFAMPTDQVIIRFRASADPARSASGMDQLLDRLSDAAGTNLTFVRPMSGGAYVFRLPGRLDERDVAAISRDLTALPEVELAEPDAILQAIGDAPSRAGSSRPGTARAADNTPDDTSFSDQWHYRYTPEEEEGLNLLPAWDLTTGSADIVVAVIDTGIRPHADLSGRTVPGFDFIHDPLVANDGDGRDNDPSDPGDWIIANQCGAGSPAQSSTWHGTHVAGTIGAASNNGSDVAGVNWNARILPVRVLGQCGGYSSDIADGVRWAAGLPVPNAPVNPNPARVVNLSLGGPGTCSQLYQELFADVNAAGVVAVVAAGNSSALADFYRPASCNNVITVAATTRTGDLAWYSNFGSAVEVSAPGGETDINDEDGVLSTLNAGTMGPGNDSLAFYQGTSMAAPHVAGLASLLLGEAPGLTPAEVLDILEATARDFPGGSDCAAWSCGAGIVDAFEALSALDALQPPDLIAPTDGAILNTSTPAFEWSAVNGAASYVLVVATDDGFVSAPIDTVVSATSFTPLAPLADGTYYWRVEAVAEDGQTFSPWSEVRTLTIDTTTPICNTPGAPELLAPAGGALVDNPQPGFEWSLAADATIYDIAVDDSEDMGSPLIEQSTADAGFTPDSPLAAGVYYWAVRGRNVTESCDISGDWSEVRSFTIEEPAGEEFMLFLPAVVRE